MNEVKNLRSWQQQALNKFFEQGAGDFLCVACPGAGKTTFALNVCARLLESREVENVIIVVPTAHLRSQWASSAVNFGLDIDDKFVNGAGIFANDYHGAAVTYSSVASNPMIYRNLLSMKRTLVVLDEVHHAGEDESLRWGDALKLAFEYAQTRLMLSGTPFRSDGNPIPFVSYDHNGLCITDMDYSYGRAIEAGDCVRSIEFMALDGEVRWVAEGLGSTSAQLESVKDDEMARALAAALSTDGLWLPSVLRQADAELSAKREDVPDAAGLVVASDQVSAQRIATMLKDISGEDPVLVISDEKESSSRIESFGTGHSRWLVAVKMVSEGVDIPRLSVGVYATNTRTRMFFRQVVGRFVRKRGPDDELIAALFIPAIPPLVEYATEIKTSIDVALAQRLEREKSESSEREMKTFTLFSSEAVHTSTILDGEQFNDGELRAADQYAKAAEMPTNVTPAQAARFLRLAGVTLAGTVQYTPPKPVSPTRKSDVKKTLREQIARMVGQFSRITGTEHKFIHADLNRTHGGSIKVATVAQLEARIVTLNTWIEAQR